MQPDTILENIKRVIHTKDPSALAYLFGSRARGDNRPDSDWDILILVDSDKVTLEIEDNFRNDLYPIEVESGQIISIFIYPKSFWEKNLRYSPLYKAVQKEGITL
jgi:predicted nucleotidyltransferase